MKKKKPNHWTRNLLAVEAHFRKAGAHKTDKTDKRKFRNENRKIDYEN